MILLCMQKNGETTIMNKKKIFNDQVVIDSVKINKNKELKGNKLH